jgi:hypothetical protein
MRKHGTSKASLAVSDREDLMNFEVWALVAKSLLVFGTQQADIVCKILPGLVVTRIKCAQVCDSHAL